MRPFPTHGTSLGGCAGRSPPQEVVGHYWDMLSIPGSWRGTVAMRHPSPRLGEPQGEGGCAFPSSLRACPILNTANLVFRSG